MNGFFHCLTLTAYFLVFANVRIGTVSNLMRYICKQLPKARIAFCRCSVSTNSWCIVEFSQPLLDEAKLEQPAAGAVCSGMCEIILNAYFGALAFVHVFPFFRLRGLRLLIIDYLVVSLLLSGCFRACLYAPLEIYASTNKRRWGLRSKEHLKEHLRRGHPGGDCPG